MATFDMKDFLGTSIQFSEQQIKKLEEEHELQVEEKVARLIEEGFLDSDYDGSSGEFSDDDDSSYSDEGDDIDNDDVDNDNNCIQQKKEMKSNDNILSSNNVVIDGSSDISDVSTADIMNIIKSNNDHHINKQTQQKSQEKLLLKEEEMLTQQMLKEQMEERKCYSTEEEEEEEQDEFEVTENIIFCATFRRISVSTSAYYSDRDNEHFTNDHFKYDTDDMTEDSEFYENYKYDEISDKIFKIVQSKQRNHNELCQMIIIDFDDNIYQIIGEYSETTTL